MTATVDLSDFGCENGTDVTYYLLDETHDLTEVAKATYYGDRFTPQLTLPNFTSYLLVLDKKA